MKLRLWVILAGIWWLVWGLLQISNFQFEQSRFIMGLLAIAISICIAISQPWKASPGA